MKANQYTLQELYEQALTRITELETKMSNIYANGRVKAQFEPIQLQRNTDLDNVTTPGLYKVPSDSDASTISNKPSGQVWSFCLFVENHYMVKQTYTTYTNSNGRLYLYKK